MNIGDNIKRIRELRGLKQSELAEILNISDKTVSSWEINRTEPKMGMIERICQALNCKKTDIIGDDDDPAALSHKDERDIAKTLEETLSQLENDQEGLLFSGEALDDETRELLKISLENSIRMAKITAKKKFTPKKYRNGTE